MALPPMVQLAKFRDAPPIAKMVRWCVPELGGRRSMKGAKGPANRAVGHCVELPVPSDPKANAEIGGLMGLGP